MREFMIKQLRTLNVINDKKLIEYVDFCIEKNQQKRIKHKTSYHHILPKAKTLPFGEFSNLKENDWNGAHLLFKDHYYAHYILTQAIDEVAILRSFLPMNFQDITNKRIKESELIGKNEYDKLVRKFVETHSKNLKEKMPEIANRIYSERDEDYRINKSKKSANTMKENGTYEKIAEKHKVYQNEIMESGLTRAQETGKKVSETRKKKFKNGELEKLEGLKNPAAKKINIYNSNNELMFECHGTFQKVCQENNLPISFLKRSYQNNGIKYTQTRGNKSSFKKEFENWYALII